MTNQKITIDKKKLDSIETALKHLKPEPKPLTASEAIKAMAETINSKRKEGVTDEQIRKALEAQGLKVSTTTFRNALKPNAAKRKTAPKPKQSATVKKAETKTSSKSDVPNLKDEEL